MRPGNIWKVYVHINKINGKRYVGITSREDPNVRWKDGNGYHENSHITAAVRKYGWDQFDHLIVADGLSESEAKKMECDLIAEWHTQDTRFGYNMTAGGDGTVGCYPSEETRRKLSEARKRENLSEETLLRRSLGLRGRKFSDDHKRKIGIGNSKQIDMYTRDGEFIRSFPSARCAEDELGISHSHISQCCHGSRNTAGGYGWKFTQSL